MLLLSLFPAAAVAQKKEPKEAGLTKAAIPANARAAIDRISENSLRGHLSFIASDLLEGRGTPSRGLDLAAEYIAAQFRRAGLEPAGDDGYYQTANWKLLEPGLSGFNMHLTVGDKTIAIQPGQVNLGLSAPVSITNAAVVKIPINDSSTLSSLGRDQIEGRVVLTELPNIRAARQENRGAMVRDQSEFLRKFSAQRPAVIVVVEKLGANTRISPTTRLIDPETTASPSFRPEIPQISVFDNQIAEIYGGLSAGATSARISINFSGPAEKPVKLRNVVGVLRGSDAQLKDTYVLLTAHYDHLGIRPETGGDNIFNGANDDGSGTASVLELASALATMQPGPKRSIVFMTFFGEERGLLGSRYYGRHPIFPIEKTVADINLEQVGRTDSSEGPQVLNASLTGFDFSDVGLTLKAAGELTGINVYKHERNSDSFFGRSDNQALADLGVPAHTLCVAFVYSDYHGAADHWDKIDYANLEKVLRTVALGLITIAESTVEPKWNEANPKAARYLEAWKRTHGG